MLAKAVAAVVLMVGLSGVGMAQSRRAVIEAAAKLQIEPAQAAKYLRHACGCTNTARILDEISALALNLELTARFDSPAAVAQELKEVVRKALEIRQYAVNIPDVQLQIKAYRSYLIGVNEIGAVLFGSNWVTITARIVSEVRMNPNGQQVTVSRVLQPGIESVLDMDPEISAFED